MRRIVAFGLLGICLLTKSGTPVAQAVIVKQPDTQATVKQSLVPMPVPRITVHPVIPNRPPAPHVPAAHKAPEERCSHCGQVIVRCRDFACINYKQIVDRNHEHKHKRRTPSDPIHKGPITRSSLTNSHGSAVKASDAGSTRTTHLVPDTSSGRKN